MIEINGVKYQEKKRAKVSKTTFSIMLAGLMLGGGMLGGGKEKQRPNADIVKEYELIQNKKSNLSRSERDWVEDQFLRKYEKV